MRLSWREIRDRGQGDPHLAADPRYARALRRISPLVSGMIVNWTKLSADAVTLGSIIAGVIGAALVPVGTPVLGLMAVLLLQFAYLLDVADGEVARIRGTVGRRGRYLDLIGHVIQNRVLFAAGGMSLIVATSSALWAIAVALLAQGLATPFGFYARLYVLGAIDEPDPDHPVESGAHVARASGFAAAYRRVAFLWNVPASTNLFCVAILGDVVAQMAGKSDRPLVLPAFFAVFGSTLAFRQLANAIRLGARSRWEA